MSTFREESKLLRFSVDEITNLRIICKNYRIQIYEGRSKDLIIRYHNSRFRKIDVSQRGSGLYLEEKMAVTIYGFFRLIQLAKDNILEIEIPTGFSKLSITVETSSTEIYVDSIHLQSLTLHSIGGQIQIRDVTINHSLSAVSESGKIFCQLPGNDADYDIDCHTEYENNPSGLIKPHYISNHDAQRKIFLRSKTYMPELIFTSCAIE